ncbi:MAG: 2-oxo acid dehydrogenase subunit E2, partial [Chloroflexi bacterium]
NIGGLFATPIIPPGQVGILGVGRIVRRPTYDAHGQIVPADMLYLSYSFDHRVLDGASADWFAAEIVKLLERWEKH